MVTTSAMSSIWNWTNEPHLAEDRPSLMLAFGGEGPQRVVRIRCDVSQGGDQRVER
jgi:hypothetical protein